MLQRSDAALKIDMVLKDGRAEEEAVVVTPPPAVMEPEYNTAGYWPSNIG